MAKWLNVSPWKLKVMVHGFESQRVLETSEGKEIMMDEYNVRITLIIRIIMMVVVRNEC